MENFKNKQFVSIAISGFITGLIFQYNWLRKTLLVEGLIKATTANFQRLIIGALAGALVFLIIYFSATFLLGKIKIKHADRVKKHVYGILSSFIFLLSYLCFKPSSDTLAAIIISILAIYPLYVYFSIRINVFKGYLKQLTFLLLVIVVIQLFNELLSAIFSVPENYYFYTVLIPSSLICLALPALFPRIIKPYTILVLAVFLLAATISVAHIITYGSKIPESAYYAIWETSTIEATDYVKQHLNIKLILVLVVVILISIACVVPIFRAKYTKTPIVGKIVLSLILFILPYHLKLADNLLPNKFINSYKNYKNEFNIFKEEIEKRKSLSNREHYKIECTSDSALTVVVVIGESASKYHQGLYGYSRQTNPLLNSIRDQLYIFDSVISPHSHTNPTLSKVLTFANHEDMEPLYKKQTMVEYMKNAGFKTFWLSNQEFSDYHTTISTSIAVESDWYFFTFDKNNPLISYDGNLLKPFDVALDDRADKKFIILHLMGSHSDKATRYPEQFNIYTTDDSIVKQEFHRPCPLSVINAHDNSVVYTDWLLSEIIERLRNKNTNCCMLYFSDHGEEIFDYRDFWGHAEANASIYMFDIPFILWLSDDYKVFNKSLVNNLPNYLTRRYQTDDVIHSIIDLTKCYGKDFEPERSIFNKEFKFRKRIIGDYDYDEMIKTMKSIDEYKVK